MKTKTSTDLALVVLGLFAWGAAAFFGLDSTVTTRNIAANGSIGSTISANIAAAGAACGFAIAGGLCFLGAAITSRTDRRPTELE